jgi:peroxiredoxin
VKQRKFKASTGGDFPFIADASAMLTKLYQVKAPLLKIAKRTTYVIGGDGLIKKVLTGSDALDPSVALGFCEVDFSGA